jgi:hypothetical protein
LAAENDNILHEVFLINADDTCSLTETPDLISRYLPKVPLREPVPGHASLVSHDKATRLLGYQSRYTWRSSDFGDWMALQTRGQGDGSEDPENQIKD